MKYDKLTLLVLAMAIEDLASFELGIDLEIPPTEDLESILHTAESLLANHPRLLERILNKRNLEPWLKQIRLAREDLVEQARVNRGEIGV